MVETDVHYPTDSNLLFDAIRKVISFSVKLCKEAGLSDFRQSKHNMKKVKRSFNYVRRLHYSKSKNEKKKQVQKLKIENAYREYMAICTTFIQKAEKAITSVLLGTDVRTWVYIQETKRFIVHAKRQIDQIDRRVLKGEKIPYEEKVFSLFEEHTEWISKGKAGVPQELGVRVAVIEDQYRFILNHKVMYKTTDEKITVPFIRETKELYPDLKSCSFDKGFYSPGHWEKLEKIIEFSILPKKGKLSGKDKERETESLFLQERKRHPGIESAINALENHGLDRCPDHGFEGFDRYISLAVLGRNLQNLGRILQNQENKIRKTG